jgi:peptidoglycan/LPS O-acetylase OafA/YrhL
MLPLSETFDVRRNSFDALRLVLAGLVAIDHGVILHTGVVHKVQGSALGDFAVDGFFILSGFLVCRSYLRLQSLPRFVWHRVLRIMPGFWVCLLVTAFLVAPAVALLEGKPVATAFTAEPPALRYVLVNAGLLMNQFDIAGLLASNPSPFTFDGSLWTLALEALCYGVLAVLGVVGVLKRQRWLVIALVAVLCVLAVLQSLGLTVPIGDLTVRMTLMFFLGSAAYLFADRVPMSIGLALVALVLFAVAVVAVEPYRLLGAAPFTYLVMWLGTSIPWKIHVRTDLSYGLYIYHFLVFQILVLTPAARLSTAVFAALGVLVTLLPAAASWFGVEKPALRRKNGPFIDTMAGLLSRKQSARSNLTHANQGPVLEAAPGKVDSAPRDAEILGREAAS